MKKRVLIIILLSFVFACGPKKGIVTKKKKTDTKPEKVEVKNDTGAVPTKAPIKAEEKLPRKRTSVDTYINTYANIAMAEMRISKIPASITLAQGILESGSGNGRLAKEANNHFGIKCHGWKGAKIYHDDDRSQECFRKYKTASTSYKDHSEFLTGRKRYANLFRLKPNDYKGWARGLRAAGYATDRKYPQKLISLIERYELYKYDNQVLGNSTKNKTTASISHTVIKGDTLYSLSRRYGLTVEAIKQKNSLTSNDLTIGQVLIIKSE
ncbi:glucosaminidase domain-containing protein [Winogradskyella haliclonae]|uniref:Peptidoglycan hydrolase n=1 Tax=Winogradskyella haliclonae TaxID=2048558 RepID=A0ABQ2BUK3_9FLAO|nr:glucosaminidase domain-containing protein [Winogradskyella haliclonae]GGI55719.1 hemagglutinin [Winogradskyella haliclonae]